MVTDDRQIVPLDFPAEVKLNFRLAAKTVQLPLEVGVGWLKIARLLPCQPTTDRWESQVLLTSYGVELYCIGTDTSSLGCHLQHNLAQLHNAEPRFRAHGGKHVRVFCDLLSTLFRLTCRHFSIVAEIQDTCQ
jgi:hypothetical protein